MSISAFGDTHVRNVENEYISPTQVKCRLLISSIFDAMNFQHFSEMLEFKFQHFQKMLEIHCIKNARN